MLYKQSFIDLMNKYDSLISTDGKAVIDKEDWQGVKDGFARLRQICEFGCDETVSGIIKRIVDVNGYDGLCSGVCGCAVQDIMKCDKPQDFCLPAMRHYCKDCDRQSQCGLWQSGI